MASNNNTKHNNTGGLYQHDRNNSGMLTPQLLPTQQTTTTTVSTHSQRYGITFTVDSRYTDLQVIGKGAYGVVCSAFDTKTDKRIAIKKIMQPFSNMLFARRLLREIKILRRLDHENIIHLLDLQKPSELSSWNEVYMITDLMDTDLHQIIKSDQSLSNEHIQYFLYQILKGVKYLHSAGVMHRDLKPGNILINSNCDIKLCDFGLARGEMNQHTEQQQQQGPNHLTEYVVTRWYRPPELLLQTKNYTRAVDIWSIGCIFAELILRKPLLPGSNYVDQLQKTINVVGFPDTATISTMKLSSAAMINLQKMEKHNGTPLKTIFRGKADPVTLDLLEKLLTFNPYTRITAAQALAHPYFSQLHNESDEPIAKFKIDFLFEQKATSIENVRKMIYEEILAFHPNMKDSVVLPPGFEFLDDDDDDDGTVSDEDADMQG